MTENMPDVIYAWNVSGHIQTSEHRFPHPMDEMKSYNPKKYIRADLVETTTEGPTDQDIFNWGANNGYTFVQSEINDLHNLWRRKNKQDALANCHKFKEQK